MRVKRTIAKSPLCAGVGIFFGRGWCDRRQLHYLKTVAPFSLSLVNPARCCRCRIEMAKKKSEDKNQNGDAGQNEGDASPSDEEPNFSDPEDFVDDISDEGISLDTCVSRMGDMRILFICVLVWFKLQAGAQLFVLMLDLVVVWLEIQFFCEHMSKFLRLGFCLSCRTFGQRFTVKTEGN